MQSSCNLIFSWLIILMTLYSLFPFYVISVCLFSFCLFNDAGLTYIKPLKDIWTHTPLLWNAGHLNVEFSCNRKHRSCEWHSCKYESQKKCLKTKFSRFKFSHLPHQIFSLPFECISVFLFRGMLWSHFSLRLLVFHWSCYGKKKEKEKNHSPFCSVSRTKIEGEGRRIESK